MYKLKVWDIRKGIYGRTSAGGEEDLDLGELFLGEWRRRVGTVDEGGEGVLELGDGGWGEMDGGCYGVGEGHGG